MSDYEIAEKIVKVILNDLSQRRGIGYELEQIDSISLNEMKATLVSKTYIAILEEKAKCKTHLLDKD